MADLIKLAIVDPNDSTRRELTDQFAGIDGFWFEGDCARYELFPKAVRESNPDVALVCIDPAPDQAIQLIEILHQQSPQTAVCAISSSNDSERILRVMRAGAREFLTLPLDTQEIVAALKRIATRSASAQRGGRECIITAVAGTGGGVGSTVVAVNLGAILASDPSNSVALVDLDLTLGDADVYLDAKPDRCTLLDIAENFERLDLDLLRRSLTKTKCGLFLLPRPSQLTETASIKEELLRGVMGLLKVMFSHVIVDLSKAYNALDLATLESANTILLVTQLSLPNLRNVIRLLRSFRELGGLDEKVKIVVNRLGVDEEVIRRKKAEEIIGREIFCELPNEYRLMTEVCSRAVPLIEYAPRAPITRSLIRLAEAVSGTAAVGDAEPSPPAPEPARGWFGLWSTPSAKK